MAKALTREDLLYILQSAFRISGKENNAFKMIEDGLYVEDYMVHANNKNFHIDETLKQILDNFSVSENGFLLYNDSPISMAISSKERNGIKLELDGIYMPDATDAINHVSNLDVHVTNEDKDNWNDMLHQAQDFVLEEISKLVLYNVEIVESLPEVSDLEQPSSSTLYLLADGSDENLYTINIFIKDKWFKIGITNQILRKYVLKTDIEDVIDNSHKHENKEALEKLSTDNEGNLLYNDRNIYDVNIHDNESNAAKMIDGKLYVEDLKNELKSLQISAAFSKVNLYDKEINDSGVYQLKDDINNYNLILVEYYYKPNNENEQPGCAKTAVIDTDVLNHLYNKNMDYMLEYGYGILMSNSKIRMNGDKLWVDYYHNVCIYKITGIRKGGNNE